MKKVLLLIIIVSATYSCKVDTENYYPPRSATMLQGKYEKYKLKLDQAYLDNNLFEVGIQLANLEGDKKKIFTELDRGIRADTSNCNRIYEWAHAFEEANFQNNIVKTDTTRFLQSVELCKQLIGKDSYLEYLEKYQRTVEAYQASKTVLDSTKFDHSLITILEEIDRDDQGPRTEMHRKGISEEEIKALWKVQHRLDSINLEKVDKILKQYGYPPKELVGHDQAGTILMVLHHQPELKTKNKYLPLLKKAVEEGKLGEGALRMYERRIKNREIDLGIKS